MIGYREHDVEKLKSTLLNKDTYLAATSAQPLAIPCNPHTHTQPSNVQFKLINLIKSRPPTRAVIKGSLPSINGPLPSELAPGIRGSRLH